MDVNPAGLAAVDPTNPQTWNRYAYVLNNPLAMVDLLGDDGCYDGAGNQITATIEATCGDYGGTWLGGGQWVGTDGNVYASQNVPQYFDYGGNPDGGCTGNCLGTLVAAHSVTINLGSFQGLYGDTPLNPMAAAIFGDPILGTAGATMNDIRTIGGFYLVSAGAGAAYVASPTVLSLTEQAINNPEFQEKALEFLDNWNKGSGFPPALTKAGIAGFVLSKGAWEMGENMWDVASDWASHETDMFSDPNGPP